MVALTFAAIAVVLLAAFLWLTWVTIRRANADVAWLRGQMAYYQRRGDEALDKAASLAIGQPITVARDAAQAVITPETLEQEVRRMVLGDHEVAHAGRVE